MPEASGSGVADESDYSTFENKTGLAEDMKFLASMPELCDVTFLVGDTREPVCAVKAVLAARSRVFHKMLYQTPSPQRKKEPPARENKIRLFLKRSSEPLLNLQNAAQQRSGFTQQLAPIQEVLYVTFTYNFTHRSKSYPTFLCYFPVSLLIHAMSMSLYISPSLFLHRNFLLTAF